MSALNRIDRNILRELQANGRLSFVELAKRVGLTTTPCIDRVKRLERDGFINQYSAQLNPEKLGAGLIVFVQIRLVRTSKANFDEFKRAIKRIPEIQECYLVSANFDFLIKARVADMNAYKDFLSETLLQAPGVQESTTIVVMDSVVESLAIPVNN